MTCLELIDFLDRYLGGELSPPQRQLFEDHLTVCPDCTAYLKSYKHAILMGQHALKATNGDVPSEVPEELVQAILDARRSGPTTS